MTTRGSGDRRIFFSWERRGGLLRRLGLHRARPLLVVLGIAAFVGLVALRERERSGVRRTRAALLGARAAVDAYRADHDGGCPRSLDDLPESTGGKVATTDAWQRPLRLRCPGVGEGSPYELWSDGADGEPGGRDKIE